VIVTGDELDATQAPGYLSLQKVSPVNFMLTERDGDPEKLPFALPIDAISYQYGYITHLTILAYLFVIIFQDKIWTLA